MLGVPTGLQRDIQCGCTVIVKQHQYVVDKCKFWVAKEHKAPCGRPCATSPGSLVGDCHITGQCELCPTHAASRKRPRARVSSVATASPILGQLTVNEVRIIHYMMRRAIDLDIRYTTNRDLALSLRMPDATIRGTLRRLALRGIVFQNKSARQWHINLSIGVGRSELFG